MAAPMTSERMDRREAEKWRWSDKALDRLAEHGFNENEAYFALLMPATRARGNSPGTQVWTRGRVSAVVDPVKRVVVTIMDAYGTRPSRQVVYTPPSPAPKEPLQPVKPEPEPTPYVADAREVKNMAERIRLLNAEHPGEIPVVPERWLRVVCLTRLRDYPQRWARLLSAPLASVAEALVDQIRPVLTAEGDEIELTARGPHIYGRSL